MTIILFIVVLAILILVHEVGHFVTSKLFGIRVDEFGLGLPPKIWGLKFGETVYSLNWLPLGGFVKIFGEDPNEENTTGPDSARSFINKPKWQQAIVLVAGVFLNLVFAWLLISINLGLGMPASLDSLPQGLKIQNQSLTIVTVLKDSPAGKAGLAVGDQLISLSAGKEKTDQLSVEAVHDFTSQFPDQPIKVEYRRPSSPDDGLLKATQRPSSGRFVTVIPKLGITGDGAAIGIAMQNIGFVSASWWQAPFYGLFFTYHLIANTLLAFGDFFSNIFTEGRGALGTIAGPIGIYGLVSDASRLGFVYLLNFTALISINLAILNLLPFPALDGGRLLFVVIEAIIRRPINPKIANALNTIGFGLLILLMAVIAISDVFKLL
ncbi:MAG: site-2 protease family protein [Candidatus Vogelbacteria bacterium]|nr:site-2 protease family protein [Candidatus Vogelbacteria bacterium]